MLKPEEPPDFWGIDKVASVAFLKLCFEVLLCCIFFLCFFFLVCPVGWLDV